MSPVRRWSSEWHRPAATNLIRTSPSLGGSRSISMISQSLPMSRSTAALVFMRTSRVTPADHHPPPRPAGPCGRPQDTKIKFIHPNGPCLTPPGTRPAPRGAEQALPHAPGPPPRTPSADPARLCSEMCELGAIYRNLFESVVTPSHLVSRFCPISPRSEIDTQQDGGGMKHPNRTTRAALIGSLALGLALSGTGIAVAGSGPHGAGARQHDRNAYLKSHGGGATATHTPDDGDLADQFAAYNNERTAPSGQISGQPLVEAQQAAAALPVSGSAWQEVTNKPYNAQPSDYTDPFWGNQGAGFSIVGGRITALATAPASRP